MGVNQAKRGVRSPRKDFCEGGHSLGPALHRQLRVTLLLLTGWSHEAGISESVWAMQRNDIQRMESRGRLAEGFPPQGWSVSTSAINWELQSPLESKLELASGVGRPAAG